jgi:hypothetical protein
MRKLALTYAREQAAAESRSLPGAIRANRSRAPADVAVATILGTYGLGSLGPWSATGRASCFSRMSQRTFDWDSATCDEISRREAIAFRRAYSRRLRSALRTSGCGCLSSPWMTPDTSRGSYKRDHGEKGLERPTVAGQAVAWTSPTAADADGTHGGKMERSLRTDIARWSTPTAEDAEQAGSKKRPGLFAAAGQWHTPSSTDHKGAARPGQRLNQLAEDAEVGFATTWATPTTAIERGTTARASKGARDLRNDSREFPTGLPAETISTPGAPCSSAGPGSRQLSARRKLNPSFVEWLMGLPRGMTGCGPVEMESFLSSQRRLLSSYLRRIAKGEQAAGAPPGGNRNEAGTDAPDGA